jgi:thiol-disulfide isomerase/thioredoxin
LAASAAAPVPTRAALKDGWEVVRQPAKAFVLQDLAGGALRSPDLQGKIVVMDFWATWCGPCIRELPDIQALTERLKARREVAFLSFNVTEEKADVLAFVKERSIAYPVYLADDLIGPYEVSAFPTKLVIDMRGQGEGVVRFRRDGYTEARSIEARIQELLDEGPATNPR